MANELVQALKEGVKALKAKNKRKMIQRGDPIIITLGSYGIVYEGYCTSGVECVSEMTNPHSIIFAEPQHWCFVPADLHCVNKDKLSPRVVESIQKRSTHNRIYNLGYCWVLKAKVVLPK